MNYQQHMNFTYLILGSSHTHITIRGLQKTETTKDN